VIPALNFVVTGPELATAGRGEKAVHAKTSALEIRAKETVAHIFLSGFFIELVDFISIVFKVQRA